MPSMAELATDGLKDSPWYVKAGVQFGVPAVLCVFLVWWIVGDSDRKHNAILADSVAMRSQVTAISGMVNAHVDSTGRSTAALLYYLQQLCLQGATNAGTPSKDCTYRDP
jgi:hypothetical protein